MKTSEKFWKSNLRPRIERMVAAGGPEHAARALVAMANICEVYRRWPINPEHALQTPELISIQLKDGHELIAGYMDSSESECISIHENTSTTVIYPAGDALVKNVADALMNLWKENAIDIVSGWQPFPAL